MRSRLRRLLDWEKDDARVAIAMCEGTEQSLRLIGGLLSPR